MFRSIIKHWHIALYGASLAVLLFFLKWIELRFLVFNHALEIYIAIIALFFTALGIWLAIKLTKPKTIVVEKEVPVNINVDFKKNEAEARKLGLSKRELEVLELMAQGLSNQEIAERLFLSLNTIKTHGSKVLDKLDVKRRTQAIEKARRLCLIP